MPAAAIPSTELSAHLDAMSLSVSAGKHAMRLVRAMCDGAVNPAWPFPHGSAHPKKKTLDILVLDSSFNPPTRAHAELVRRASAARPFNSREAFDPLNFDAILLLLATHNIDKGLILPSNDPAKPGVEERVRLILALLPALAAKSNSNVAVGLITAPKFNEKAECLRDWMDGRAVEVGMDGDKADGKMEEPKARFHFLLGWDTVVSGYSWTRRTTRGFFDPKYYPPQPLKDSLSPFFSAPSTIIFADRPIGAHSDSFIDTLHQFSELYEIPDWTGPGMELLSSTLGRARIGGYWRAVDSGNAGDAEDAEKGVLEVVDESVWEKVKEAGLYRGV